MAFLASIIVYKKSGKAVTINFYLVWFENDVNLVSKGTINNAFSLPLKLHPYFCISTFIYVFAARAKLSVPVTFYFPSLRLNDRQDTISTSLGRFRILIEKDGRKTSENKVK